MGIPGKMFSWIVLAGAYCWATEITCTRDDIRGQTLDLSTKGIVNLDNTTLAACAALPSRAQIRTITFELGRGSIETITPGAFSVLRGWFIQNLNFASNQLKQLQPGTFKGLPQLASLDLSGNYLEYVDPNALEGLWQLDALDLTHNVLSTIEQGVCAPMPGSVWWA